MLLLLFLFVKYSLYYNKWTIFFFAVNTVAIAIAIAIIIEVGMNKREDTPSLFPVCKFLSMDCWDCFQTISIPFVL